MSGDRVATAGTRKPKSQLAAAALAGVALVFAAPSSVLAVGLLQDGASLIGPDGIAAFTPASADPRVAQIVAERSAGKTRFMRFTPAGSDFGNRSVTVAVRVNEDVARAISVRSAIDAAGDARGLAQSTLRIAPSRYNLGLARGYQSFVKSAPALAAPISRVDMPDLADFKPSAGVKQKPSRFAARVQLEPEDIAGRSARLAHSSNDAVIDQTLDVAGSYRLTRNLNVTAGVRYSQDRDALVTLPDIDEQDSQAVYIGTQFRF